MAVFDHAEFDNHESLHFVNDASTGLRAIIAIHSTTLGPAAGGCRYWSYTSDADALTDVLRLSRGMTYKNAVAELPFGGGKAVILADDTAAKTPRPLFLLTTPPRRPPTSWRLLARQLIPSAADT